MDYDKYRVATDAEVRLADWDPNDRSLFDGGKKARKERVKELNAELEELQELLYAEGKHKILVVLQAPDTGGKDGTIRHVFDGTNPQGVRVASFKKPTPRELSQDFLWRYHQHCPRNGQITIFNRSHYEDVLIVRVHDLVPRQVWERRYDHIKDFERMLHDEGTTFVKIFLHISKDEQRERLQARLDEPHKTWKFSHSDVKERRHWDEYQKAYEAMLQKTSTPWAPWYVVPANSKSYRNIVVSRILIDRLRGLDMNYPDPEPGLSGLVVE